jgi:hypothetical protein
MPEAKRINIPRNIDLFEYAERLERQIEILVTEDLAEVNTRLNNLKETAEKTSAQVAQLRDEQGLTTGRLQHYHDLLPLLQNRLDAIEEWLWGVTPAHGPWLKNRETDMDAWKPSEPEQGFLTAVNASGIVYIGRAGGSGNSLSTPVSTWSPLPAEEEETFLNTLRREIDSAREYRRKYRWISTSVSKNAASYRQST